MYATSQVAKILIGMGVPESNFKARKPKKEKIRKRGRPAGFGTSREYVIGKYIYDNVGFNENFFVENFEDLNPKNIIIRLYRLNEQNKTDYKYSYYFSHDIIEENGDIKKVEGFRIHRVK